MSRIPGEVVVVDDGDVGGDSESPRCEADVMDE